MCALWAKTSAANNYENPDLSFITRPVLKPRQTRGKGMENYTKAALRGMGIENYTKAALRGMGIENYTKAAPRGMGKCRAGKKGGFSLASLKKKFSKLGEIGQKIFEKIFPSLLDSGVNIIGNVVSGALDGNYVPDAVVTQQFQDLLKNTGKQALSAAKEEVVDYVNQRKQPPKETIPVPMEVSDPSSPTPTLEPEMYDIPMPTPRKQTRKQSAKSGKSKKLSKRAAAVGSASLVPKFNNYDEFRRYLMTI